MSSSYSHTHVVAKFNRSMSHSVTCSDLMGLVKSCSHCLLQINVPLEAGILHVKAYFCASQRGTESLSGTFTLTVPSWWNDLPNQPDLTQNGKYSQYTIRTYFTRWLIRTTALVQIHIIFAKLYIFYELPICKNDLHLSRP